MKYIYLFACLFSILIYTGSGFTDNKAVYGNKQLTKPVKPYTAKDTCMIEGQAFTMRDYSSKRIMRAYIKNGQISVVNEGLQFAKYRIIQYIFYSLTDENMPTFRWGNPRLSPPILQVLKNARVGEQFLFEDIVIVDQQNKVLPNSVRPLMIERVKN